MKRTQARVLCIKLHHGLPTSIGLVYEAQIHNGWIDIKYNEHSWSTFRLTNLLKYGFKLL